MRVEVYKNIRTGKYSVRSLETGKVILRHDCINLKNVTFAVQPAGREKVRREGRKNVHAFVRGELTNTQRLPKPSTQVIYNPYKLNNFCIDGDPKQEIFEAPYVALAPNGVFI